MITKQPMYVSQYRNRMRSMEPKHVVTLPWEFLSVLFAHYMELLSDLMYRPVICSVPVNKHHHNAGCRCLYIMEEAELKSQFPF